MSVPTPCSRCGLPRETNLPCPSCLLLVAHSFDATPPNLEGQRFGRYILGPLLGRGGMGMVYDALDPRLGRTVALKILADDAHPSEQLQREAELAAALDHEHIVPVYEAGEHEGIAYFTMKRINGGTLATPAPNERRAAEITLCIAKAIEFAHRHGTMHLDLKPANVLMDTSERVFVTDFGLATRDTLEAKTIVPQMGTPMYMAPEVWKGERGAVSTAADVWGAGIILYELLMGKPPFRASTADELMNLITTAATPQLEGVSVDLAAVCRCCLEKDPANRYATASDLVIDLTRYLRGEPVSLRPKARQLYLMLHQPLFLGFVAGWCLMLILAAYMALDSRQVQFQSEQDLVEATKFVADSLAAQASSQFRSYSDFVEASSRDKRVIDALSGRGALTPSQLCAKLHEEHEWSSAVWALFDQNAQLVGRFPSQEDDAKGISFTFRDYYRGALEVDQEIRRKAYVSRAYHSAVDSDFKVAVSMMVHDETSRRIGLLLVSFPTGSMLGNIALPKGDFGRRTIAVIAPRDPGQPTDDPTANHQPEEPDWVFLVQSNLERGAEVRADIDMQTDSDQQSAFTRIVPIEATPFKVYVRTTNVHTKASRDPSEVLDRKL